MVIWTAFCLTGENAASFYGEHALMRLAGAKGSWDSVLRES